MAAQGTRLHAGVLRHQRLRAVAHVADDRPAHRPFSPIRANREIQPEGQMPLPAGTVHRRPAAEGQRLRDRLHGQVGHGHVRHHRQPAEARLRPLLRLQLPAPCPQLLPDVPLRRRQALRTRRKRRRASRRPTPRTSSPTMCSTGWRRTRTSPSSSSTPLTLPAWELRDRRPGDLQG